MRFILVVFLLCVSHGYSWAQNKELTYNGNTFMFGLQNVKDTLEISDPISGVTKTVVRDNDFPISMNGRRIYVVDELDVTSREEIIQNRPEEHIVANLGKIIYPANFADGRLFIRSIRLITDENGRIVYTDFDGIKYTENESIARNLSINNKDALFDGIKMPVAIYKGRKVAYVRTVYPDIYRMEIKGGKIVSHLRP